MNEETLPMNEPHEAWMEPEPQGPDLNDRINQLEEALAMTLGVMARQQASFASVGLAQKMAAEIGRPEAAAQLAQEFQAVPGLSDAMSAYPILGDMARAWASQKVSQPPLAITGELNAGAAGTGKQKQLATDLQRIAGDLGITLTDQDALEVYSGV